ncbi:hypothetical protein [Lentibacillus sediminis]|uniref:hypothetical protein n=1 Tax=Lentibacillus sediminis TaxID=1940529 RepID=UPI000C1C30A0|nr:hypothetical protein [Lentibacillus sediminis]
MLVSCLILKHSTITSFTKMQMVQAIFFSADVEINETDDHTVVTYIWNAGRDEIWQAVADFQTTNMRIGYGFGERKIDAKREALKKLEQWMEMEDGDDFLSTD